VKRKQETQLLLTNHATHLCNMQWRGWPPKTGPYTYVSPRRICWATSKVCKHK